MFRGLEQAPTGMLALPCKVVKLGEPPWDEAWPGEFGVIQ